MAKFEVKFLSEGKELGRHGYVFGIEQAGEHFRTVVVVLPRAAQVIVAKTLGFADVWHAPEESPEFRHGMFRFAVRSIEDALRAGAIEPDEGETYTIEVAQANEEMSLIAELGNGDKTCSYQLAEGRDLYCTCAADNDTTRIPIVLSSGRLVAPTSRPLCAGCSLPDTDYICSHFLHPEVIGVRVIQGLVGRQCIGGLCDLNRAEFSAHNECHAGGNPCWTRFVETEETQAIKHTSLQAIEHALDDFDVRWRLSFGKRVVRLPGAEDISTLALASDSRADFDRKLDVLSDIFKRLDIADELFEPEGERPDPDHSHSFARLELLLRSRLTEDDFARAESAIRTLRDINRLRAGSTHSGDARSKRAQLADSLGVPLDGRWSEAWERIRGVTSVALRELGSLVQRLSK